MDIRSKNYSHSLFIKVIVFIITVLCFTGAITVFINMMSSISSGKDLSTAFENDYFLSQDFMRETSSIVQALTTLVEYGNEEKILKGETVREEELEREKNNLFHEFVDNYSKGYNPGLSHEENYQKFEEVYAAEIAQIKDELIAEDLEESNFVLQELGRYQGIYYYGSDGVNVFSNSPDSDKNFFKAYPAYMILGESEETVYPSKIRENPHYNWLHWPQNKNNIIQQNENVLYIAFTDEYLNPKIEEWKSNKKIVTDSLYQIIGFLAGLVIAFVYLLVIIGRKFFGDKEVHLNFMDKLYNDLNIVMCFSLIALWFGLMDNLVFRNKFLEGVLPITLFIGTLGLILVLSLVKHIKNRTFLKHSLTFTILYKIFKFFKEIYDSGSIGVKVVVVVIGYPLLVALTFFMFPVTIGVAVWLAFKKVKNYQAVKEGVEKVKAGDLHHKINVEGNGEFAKLADDINSITDGLNKAVANELKSERLKTELITNVSHDIRTPLTSIITYVDLLKNEEDQRKAEEYIEIIEQKSQRLKVLTDDLFEASKASSGNIPVNYEKIDIVSLITQGLGEVDDKIQELELEFKVNYPEEKVFITADGKLLWRAIENLLSNIFKYALKGSRVYIDIEDLGTQVKLVIKNISAYELNISSEELMERFKRGDESRNSQGSGLGLSIAKSMIEIQKGSFNIEIDGDLFKAIIKMPK